MAANIVEPSALERKVCGTLVQTFLYRRLKGPVTKPDASLGGRAVTIRSPKGGRLAGIHYAARHGHAKGIVVLAHPHKRYAQGWFLRGGWVQWLQDHGYSVLTFDFNQYGSSKGGDPYLHDQVIAAAQYARTLEPGAPVHIIGVSIGSYALANAAPKLDFVESITLESPYTEFIDWYASADSYSGLVKKVNQFLHKTFKKTYARINATTSIAQAAPERILITAMTQDTETPVQLSRQVAAHAPPRADYYEIDGPDHLNAFGESNEYREAILANLSGGPRPFAPSHPRNAASSTSVATAQPQRVSGGPASAMAVA